MEPITIFQEEEMGNGFSPEFILWLQNEIVGVHEIIPIVEAHPNYNGKITKQRVFELTHNKMFPHPIASLAMGRMWLRTDVINFLDIKRFPGRPISEK